jgi:hypothetical protein
MNKTYLPMMWLNENVYPDVVTAAFVRKNLEVTVGQFADLI